MGRRKRLGLILLASGLSALVAHYARIERAPAEVGEDAAAESVSDPEQTQAQPLAESVNLEAVERLAAAMIAGPKGEHEPTEEASHSEEDVEYARRIERNRVNAPHFMELAPKILDERIAEQKSDPEWTARVASEIEQKLSAMPAGANELLDVECYELLCKARFRHADRDARQDFGRSIAREGELAGPGHQFGSRDPDGIYTTTVYVAHQDGDEWIHDGLSDLIFRRVTGTDTAGIEVSPQMLASLSQSESNVEAAPPTHPL